MKINLGKRKKARIEMLPLIDIVFLLLVFFIYAMLSMAVHRSLPVALPESTTAEIDTKPQISVSITDDGVVYVNEQVVDISDLSARLSGMDKAARDGGVQVFADRNVDYQHLFTVLDSIKQAGITSISLQAEKDAGN